ncbi:MAG TPA: RNA pseudouridine synthase [Novosphingobium sp.]|nr:RNA pseudouridine synthase [Novosphingobium sp.]
MTPFPILFEDGEALVIDKPAGLPVDAPRDGATSLENYLHAFRLGFQRAPVAVHRLDRDTSGCLLLARNPKALRRFSAAFEARRVDKRYLGVVASELAEDEGTIDLALAKISSAAEGWRMIAARTGKPAVTHWRRLDTRSGHTLVEFRPETGRTHQIRLHALAGLGVPLLGDPVYGRGDNAARTMLHAAGLAIERDGKPPIVAAAPLPADFVALGFTDNRGAFSDG